MKNKLMIEVIIKCNLNWNKRSKYGEKNTRRREIIKRRNSTIYKCWIFKYNMVLITKSHFFM